MATTEAIVAAQKMVAGPMPNAKTMTPIQQYMRRKHRHHLSQATIEKNRRSSSRLRIQQALLNVDRQAKAALLRSSFRRGNDVAALVALNPNDGEDGVSSITADRPPRMVEVPSVPLSDVTNTAAESFETNPGAFALDVTVDSMTPSYMGGDKRGGLVRLQDEASVSVEMPKSTLSPRRQWEIEPLQNALRQFALVEDAFIPMSQPRHSNEGLKTKSCKGVFVSSGDCDAIHSAVNIEHRHPIHSVLELISMHSIVNPTNEQTRTECSVQSGVDTGAVAAANKTEHSVDAIETSAKASAAPKSTRGTHDDQDANRAAWLIGDTATNNEDDKSIEVSSAVHKLEDDRIIALAQSKRDDTLPSGQSSVENVEVNNASLCESEVYDDSFYSEDCD